MFKEISKMEQRYDAVLMVIKDGYSVSEVARKVKVSRQTLYKWLADYEAGGLEGLGERSHRPHHVPHRLDGAREAAIIAMRLAHPRWGPVRIAHELKATGVAPPALMTIHRVLARRGLIPPRGTQETPDLQALGTGPAYGAVADGRGWRGPHRERRRSQDPHGY